MSIQFPFNVSETRANPVCESRHPLRTGEEMMRCRRKVTENSVVITIGGEERN
jgi:hypothetical protein